LSFRLEQAPYGGRFNLESGRGLVGVVVLLDRAGDATLGPLALGARRDGLGSYAAGWLLVLGLAAVLTLTALGVRCYSSG